jgi:hypothetical protein
MPETLEGFPFWKLIFDDDGRLTAPDEAALIAEIRNAKLTDFFIFSHGWNNSFEYAMSLYRRFFGEIRKIVDNSTFASKRDATIGAAGVIWPSMFFPDEMPDAGGGAASLGNAEDPFTELRKTFKDPAQQSSLDDLERLLSEQKRSDAALKEFLGKLKQFAESTTESRPQSDVTDDMELRGVTETEEEWREVLNVLAEGEEAGDGQGGAAGVGDAFAKLWSGAKGALRVTSYWLMKDRAGKVGRQGLGPLIGRINTALPELRVHLIGHSFGARLVSFALAGLPAAPAGGKSPVKSLY